MPATVPGYNGPTGGLEGANFGANGGAIGAAGAPLTPSRGQRQHQALQHVSVPQTQLQPHSPSGNRSVVGGGGGSAFMTPSSSPAPSPVFHLASASTSLPRRSLTSYAASSQQHHSQNNHPQLQLHPAPSSGSTLTALRRSGSFGSAASGGMYHSSYYASAHYPFGQVGAGGGSNNGVIGSIVGVGAGSFLLGAAGIPTLVHTASGFSNSESPGGIMAECDYDVNPTELYRLIEARSWTEAIAFLDDDDDEDREPDAPNATRGSGGADGAAGGVTSKAVISAGMQRGVPKGAPSSTSLQRPRRVAAAEHAATWVVRKEKNGKLRWRLLPIHAAIIFRCPREVIEALLAAYPASAQCKDDQGMLPVHLAFRNDAPDDVVEILLRAYPAAVTVKDRKGRIPLQCASSTASSNPKRGAMINTYAAIAVAAERAVVTDELSLDADRRIAQVIADSTAELDRTKREYEEKISRRMEQVNRVEKELSALFSERDEMRRQADERSITVDRLTEKVCELSRALEEATTVRAEERERHQAQQHENKEKFSSLQSEVENITLSRDMVSKELTELHRAVEKDNVERDMLRKSIEDLASANGAIAAERDDLRVRALGLTECMEGVLKEHSHLREAMMRQEQNFRAAAVVRERMMAAIAKQESDVAEASAVERTNIREIMDRSFAEADRAFRLWGLSHSVSVETSPSATAYLQGYHSAGTEVANVSIGADSINTANEQSSFPEEATEVEEFRSNDQH